MTDNTEVHTVFLSTINEGKLYDARLKAAFHDRFEKQHRLDSFAGAITWCGDAMRAIRFYEREHAPTGLGFSPSQALQLAVMLAEYYAAHINEFTLDERVATVKRLGFPGINVRD